jgi:hypothetical protein
VTAVPITAARALALARRAESRYRSECAHFEARSRAWDRRFADNPVTADSRKRGDAVRAEHSANAAWYRDEAVMYALLAQALRGSDDEHDWHPAAPKVAHDGYRVGGVR